MISKEFISEWKRVKETWNKQLKTVIKNRPVMFGTHRLEYFKKIMNSIHVTQTIDDLIVFGIIDYEPLEQTKIKHYINFIRAIISKVYGIVIENIDYLSHAQNNFVYDDYNVYNTDIYHIDHENYFGMNDNDYLKLFDIEQFKNYTDNIIRIVDKENNIDIEVKYNDFMFQLINNNDNNDIIDDKLIDDIRCIINGDITLNGIDYYEVDNGNSCIDNVYSENGIIKNLDKLNKYILFGEYSNIHCVLELYTPKQ